MKTLLLLLLMLGVDKTYSQNVELYKRRLLEDGKDKFFLDNHVPPKVRLHVDKLMAENKDYDNDVLQLKLTPKKIGSNGMGATVYNMMPYNMPCIVPDSTFISKMPITNFNSTRPSLNK